ncbi:short chain dehydrogenase [Pseudomonas eucalypticola]|uniref:Short chain dehydrogenase n=1 Tax=Pseudomonas eucalypticola TaxID=2599595 RepID=A0A7D5H768_9PSED|nr:short chain dehydrogenase [Pseudomonas eucalypticola]QKZ04824.1 short chain dehydrogenase [Pseudomonas eucalypticola]
MIDSATGMRAGERYTVETRDDGHQFPGFFLDGKYYLSPELLTAVGWVEGQQFIYDQLDPNGAPVFADRIAGIIEDLTLTLVEGASLKLQAQRFISQEHPSDPQGVDEEDTSTGPTLPIKRPSPAVIWAAVGAAFVVGTALGRLLAGHQRR